MRQGKAVGNFFFQKVERKFSFLCSSETRNVYVSLGEGTALNEVIFRILFTGEKSGWIKRKSNHSIFTFER